MSSVGKRGGVGGVGAEVVVRDADRAIGAHVHARRERLCSWRRVDLQRRAPRQRRRRSSATARCRRVHRPKIARPARSTNRLPVGCNRDLSQAGAVADQRTGFGIARADREQIGDSNRGAPASSFVVRSQNVERRGDLSACAFVELREQVDQRSVRQNNDEVADRLAAAGRDRKLSARLPTYCRHRSCAQKMPGRRRWQRDDSTRRKHSWHRSDRR